MLHRLREGLDRAGKFLRDVRAELAKVNWPTRRETGVYTLVVVASVAAVALVIFVFDVALSLGIEALIRRVPPLRATR